MSDGQGDLGAWIDTSLEPGEALGAVLEELVQGLARRGLGLHLGPERTVVQRGREIGRVVEWVPGARIRLEWYPLEWVPGATVHLEIRADRIPGGSRLTVSYGGWREAAEGLAPDLAGWFALEVAAPLLAATSPADLGDWLTDRRARRPSGAAARHTYRDPTYHRPNFRLLLKVLALGPDDTLLDVGCGGGAFLKEALRSGCRAAAVDHSPEMVRLAREVNREDVDRGRLALVEGDAERLPYATGGFSCAVSTGVFGFIPDPLAALREIHRALRPGGRLALFAGTKDLAGTPAAPEPLASRIRFYEDAELRRLAQDAGFVDVEVERPNLEPFAREAGLSEADVAVFRGGGGAQLLTARRP